MTTGWLRIYVSAAALALAVTACILPPDIEPPPEVNNGPQIDRVNAPPAPPAPFVEISSACSATFIVKRVQETDLGDTLYYRWFVDYQDYDIAKGETPQILFAGQVPPDGQEWRGVPPRELQIKGSQYFTNLSKGSQHILEFVVSDRPFAEYPDPKTPVTGGKTDTYTWVLTLTSDCGY